MGVFAERFLPRAGHIFEYPRMGKFVGANRLQFRTKQAAHEADLMDDSVKVGAALGVTQNVRAFVIVAGHFEQCLKIDAVYDGGFDVGAGKSDEARKKSIELFFDVLTNFFGFVIVEHCVLRIASAEGAPVGEFSEIGFNGQTANKTVVRKSGAALADVLFLFGDFVNEDENALADFVAANSAFIGNGSSGLARRES